MTRPLELDVPHWAIKIIARARQDTTFDPKVTDRMIYARMLANADKKLSGSDNLKMLLSLNEEVQ